MMSLLSRQSRTRLTDDESHPSETLAIYQLLHGITADLGMRGNVTANTNFLFDLCLVEYFARIRFSETHRD